MDEFRYGQLCPIARAAELVGERWTLLVLRELFLGPQRFSDLRRRLRGLSPSVLSQRLARLEQHGLVRRRTLPPPAASQVYELLEPGRALLPALLELARWGMRFLFPAPPDAYAEPEWVRMALRVFARRSAAPARSFELHVRLGEDELVAHVAGGPEGTTVRDEGGPADVRLSGPAEPLLALLAGVLAPEPAALQRAGVRVEGDLGALSSLPELFEVRPAPDTIPGPVPDSRS